MSTHTITTQPTYLFDGQQESVSLYNAGPSTVYLESHSGVSALNSHVLPATATMEWKGGYALWAVTQSGTARLSIQTAGHITDASRANVYQLIYDQKDVSTQTELIETGAYRTLIIESGNLAVDPGPWGGFTDAARYYDWYDENRVLIETETTRHWRRIGPDESLRVTLPVRGVYCRIRNEAGYAPNDRYIRVRGTNVVYPYSATNIPTVAFVYNLSTNLIIGDPATNINVYRGTIQTETFQYSNVNHALFLPTWHGEARFHLHFVNWGAVGPSTSNHSVTATELWTGREFDFKSNPSGSQRDSWQFYTPQGHSAYITVFNGVTPNTLVASTQITWPDNLP